MVQEGVLVKEAIEILEMTGTDDPVTLVVWNDNVNTFEWVIESLVAVCDHTHDQAEQCAWIIHYKGKYAVKQGTAKKLTPMREALVDRGIGATLEETANA
ncbi:MAG: ATP-dependent Clp protease adaptor ClpS [Bacteroidetes bacterium]|jgi:ATP-dependent Clp protease adaptor protein ClpS|nr:MAG: ATP-dependent Clp protease adaptor ClpS [Bacteroidota bacterium]